MAQPTVIVTPPNQLFTLSRRFGAAAGGYIYIGEPDTDPVLTQNRVPVYVQAEDGTFSEIPQPVRVNAAGYAVYEGKPIKMMVDGNYSMKICDVAGVQQFYFHNLMKYDPDQFPIRLKGSEGWELVGAGNNTLKEELGAHGRTTSSLGIGWKNPADADETTDHAAQLKAMIAKERFVIIDTICNTSQRLESAFTYQRFEASGVGVLRPITDSMANKAVLQINHSYCQVAHLVIDNFKELKTVSGPGRQVGVDIRADYCMVRESIFFRCLQGVQASADTAARGTKVLNNWFFEHLGAGDVIGASSIGEDRGDAVTIWGSESVVMGNYAFCREDQDARIAFHCEDVHLQITPRPMDGHYNLMIGNFAYGPFRRHFVFENQINSMMIGNVSGGGATWWAEAMAMCKNCKSNNVIYWDLKSGTTTGATWSPIRGAVCSVNYNTDVTFGSKVMFTDDAVGYGFVTGTQTGEHVFSLDLDLKGNGKDGNSAFYLIRPKEARLRGCRIENFYNSVKFVGTSGGVSFTPTLLDNGSYHQCTSGTVINMTTGSGGIFIAANSQYITTADYAVSLSNMDKLIASACGFDCGSAPISTFVKAGTILRVVACYNSGSNTIAMRINGSTQFTVGVDSDWFFSANGFRVGVLHALTALQSATSKLNTLHRYTGMMVSVSRAAVFDIYVASNGSPTGPWRLVSLGDTVTPS